MRLHAILIVLIVVAILPGGIFSNDGSRVIVVGEKHSDYTCIAYCHQQGTLLNYEDLTILTKYVTRNQPYKVNNFPCLYNTTIRVEWNGTSWNGVKQRSERRFICARTGSTSIDQSFLDSWGNIIQPRCLQNQCEGAPCIKYWPTTGKNPRTGIIKSNKCSLTNLTAVEPVNCTACQQNETCVRNTCNCTSGSPNMHPNTTVNSTFDATCHLLCLNNLTNQTTSCIFKDAFNVPTYTDTSASCTDCHQNASCISHHECRCNGTYCTGPDWKPKCSQKCHPGASYAYNKFCVCNEGFKGNGKNCTQMDKPGENGKGCPSNETCAQGNGNLQNSTSNNTNPEMGKQCTNGNDCSSNETCVKKKCILQNSTSNNTNPGKNSCEMFICDGNASHNNMSQGNSASACCTCNQGYVGNGNSCKTNQAAINQLLQISNTTEGVASASVELEQITKPGQQLNASSFKGALGFLKQVGQNAANKKIKVSVGTFSSLANSASQLATGFWGPGNSPGVGRNRSQESSEMIEAITNIALSVDLSATNGSLNISTGSFEIAIQKHPGTDFPSLTYSPQNANVTGKAPNIELPSEATELAWKTTTNNSARVKRQTTSTTSDSRKSLFIFYKDDTLFYSQNGTVTTVLAANLGAPVYNLSNPVKIQHDNQSTHGKQQPSDNTLQALQTSLKCAYWNFDANDWASDGCCLNSANPPECHCNHLTNFALLVVSDKVPADVALSVVSDVGCVLSILGLLATIIIHVMSRDVRKRRPAKILMHICANLMASYLIFVAGVGRAQNNRGACTFVAALLHYFLLTTWCWMAVYSYEMYMSVVKVFHSTPSKYIQRCASFSYLSPLAVVILTLAIAVGYFDQQTNTDFCTGVANPLVKSHYRAANMCWLTEYSLYFGFLLPVGILLLFNCIVFASVFREISCKNVEVQSSATRRTTKQNFVVACSMTALMGITWLFGYLMLISSDVIYLRVMAWFFALFNTLQGLCIFLLTAVRSPELRRVWWNPITRTLPTTSSWMKFSKKEYTVTSSLDTGKSQATDLASSAVSTAALEERGLQLVDEPADGRGSELEDKKETPSD